MINLRRTIYVYIIEAKRRAEDEGDTTVMPHKKRGRPVLLGEMLDSKVQSYLKVIGKNGGGVSSGIVY